MKLGGYEVTGEVGRGGMGAVFRGRSPRGEDVAIKVLLRMDERTMARFERERRLLGAFAVQEGFVPLLDAGHDQGRPYLVMPFVPGGTLRAKLERGPLGIEQTLELANALAGALARAHERGIVHRDLKPENVLFGAGGEPLIADLGLAKHFTLDSPGGSQSISLSLKGEARGTPGYMAPEQAASATEAGPEADVFALGAILYECLAGFPAFTGSTIVEIIAKAAEARREPLGRARPDAPRWLAAIIEHALEPAPPDRFADAGAMLEALEKGPPPSRAPLVLGLAVVLAVVVVVAVIRALPKRASEPPPPAPAPIVHPPSPVATLPAWFRSLEPKPRVPESLVPTETKGEYLARVDGSVFLHVPEIRCRLGASADDLVAAPQEMPEYEVVLSPFFVSKYKVTHAQFARFVAETGYRTKPEGPLGPVPEGDARDWEGPHITELGMSVLSYFAEPSANWQRPSGSKGPSAKDDDPVVQIFWEDALEYGKWVGGTLPSESQWECVARWNPETKTTPRYPWGDDSPDETKARYFHVSPTEEHPRPVPLGPAHEALNVSPLGAVQVAGNAREWVLDDMSLNHEWLAGKDPPLRDPVFKQQPGRPYYHVAKGGSIREGGDHLRGAFRQTARGSDDRTSFRLVIRAN